MHCPIGLRSQLKESAMIFSLQRRFLIFLLLPVTLILVITGVASFMYARAYLLGQWESAAKLKLERSAHQIQMRLDQKKELIDLIVEAEAIPDGAVTQAFLVQKLRQQEGVSFVDLQDIPLEKPRSERAPFIDPSGGAARGRNQIRLVGYSRTAMQQGHHHGMMQGAGHRRMPPGRMGKPRPIEVSLDRSGKFLSIVKIFGGTGGKPLRSIVVQVSFNSFMKNILEIGRWEGSYACLVTADGTYLAHTGISMNEWSKLGETGDPLETRVLKEMKSKHFGTVFGSGHPPDWIMGFYKVPSTDWFLILSSRGSVVLAPIVRFRFNYALAGIASLICIGLLIRWNTRPVARSVGEISNAAEKVESGDYSAKVAEDRSDEIGKLKRRFNKMIEGLKQRELIERTFGRYVDRKIAGELMNRPEAQRLGGEKHVVTIMMADLRGFTATSEKLGPEEVIKLVNRHFSKMIAVIDKYSGIIVDFYGDSVLAFFNGLQRDVSARAADAVKCAVEMQREMDGVSKENRAEGLPSLHMGIGIHTGEVVVGNIGSETRAKYGIVGSSVNETDRIQSSAEGGTIMISEQTHELLTDRIVVGPGRRESFKGLDGFRDLYPVRSIDGETHLPTA